MRRPVFTLASVLSLLLCLATVTLWLKNNQIVIGDMPAKDGDYYVLVTDFRGFLTARFHGVPYGVVALISLALPTAWVVINRRDAREQARTYCQTCDYDLTGNTSGTCPECGTAIPQASQPA